MENHFDRSRLGSVQPTPGAGSLKAACSAAPAGMRGLSKEAFQIRQAYTIERRYMDMRQYGQSNFRPTRMMDGDLEEGEVKNSMYNSWVKSAHAYPRWCSLPPAAAVRLIFFRTRSCSIGTPPPGSIFQMKYLDLISQFEADAGRELENRLACAENYLDRAIFRFPDEDREDREMEALEATVPDNCPMYTYSRCRRLLRTDVPEEKRNRLKRVMSRVMTSAAFDLIAYCCTSGGPSELAKLDLEGLIGEPAMRIYSSFGLEESAYECGG